MADGPVIQRAGERALKHGRRACRRAARWLQISATRTKTTPIVLMGYANPIEAMGIEKFAAAAKAPASTACIVVDYPPEECRRVRRPAEDAATSTRSSCSRPTSTEASASTKSRAAAAATSTTCRCAGVTGAANIDISDIAANIPRFAPPREAADRRRLRHPRRRVGAPRRADRRRGGDRQPHHPGNRGRQRRVRGGAGRRLSCKPIRRGARLP